MRILLAPLHSERYAVAAAQAQRRHAATQAPLLEGMQQGREDPRPTRANRVTERDSAAVDVDLPGIDPELRHHGDELG